MHPNTRFCNGYLSATESRETTQNMSFWPKEMDWACSFRKNKKHFRNHKVVHCMHPNTRFHNGYLSVTEWHETTKNKSFNTKEVDWACLLPKNKKHILKYKVVHCMHPNTRFRNGYLSATESRETTQNISFWPKEVDWACSFRKTKKHFWNHKVVHCMHPNTRFRNGYHSATEWNETTKNKSFRTK